MAQRRVSRCSCIRPPTVGPGITATIPGGATLAHSDHSGKREEFRSGVGFSDRTRQRPSSLRRCWSMAFCTSRCRTMFGRSTRAPDTRSGTTPIRRIRGCTLVIAAWACTRMALFFDARCAPGLSQCEGRQGALECEVADHKKGYWTTMAPLVVGNHVLIGVSGDFDNLQRLHPLGRSRRPARRSGSGIRTPPRGNAQPDHGRNDVDDRNV